MLNRFSGTEASAEYKQAVSVLKKLLAKEGEETATHAFAEATSEARETAFAESFGMKKIADTHPTGS